MNNIKDKIKGCLFGGAAGDALGYAVEFSTEREIFGRYGNIGIEHFELRNGKAVVSDDTQMTLFTANGLMVCHASVDRIKDIDAWRESLDEAYKEWYVTQRKKIDKNEKYKNWITYEEVLNIPRAPGGTCLSALSDNYNGSINNQINNSKGCGGVMRVAPIGIYYPVIGNLYEVAILGAEASAITHGHSLGYIPSAMLTYMISKIIYGTDNDSAKDLKEITLEALDYTVDIFKDDENIEYFNELMKKAVILAEDRRISDIDGIHKLGEGWVAEEALAIAVFAALRYENDFAGTIIAAVNHKGDSDSTGAIAGNIVGAYLGFDKIPDEYIDKLDARDILFKISEDLYTGCYLNDADEETKNAWKNLYKVK